MTVKLYSALLLIAASFIFSSCSEDEIYPAANFSTTGFVPGFKWKLDATGSLSVSNKQLTYRWDYDKDQSQFDTPWLTDPVFAPVEDSESDYIKIVTLQVKDENGLISKISEEVHRSDFLYYFRHDTIRFSRLKIPYNAYRWYKPSKLHGGDWMRQNALSTNNSIATNLNDSLKNGSYFSWDGASTFSVPNLSYRLATKEDWEGLINLLFGSNLAGYNLQVDNLYGMGLGLHGYMLNNQMFENGEKCYYWTKSEVDDTHAWALEIVKNSDSVQFVSLPKNYKCKVRLFYPM